MGCCSSLFADNALYIITPIFNPAGFNSRVRLYNEFAARLQSDPNVVLCTIECVFGSQSFSVTDADNPHHVQIRTSENNVWWVKENLINICANLLPESSQYIAWMDADIEYPKDNLWIVETIQKFIKGYRVLQLFSEVDMLGPSGEILERNKSFGYHIAHNDWSSYAHPGMAWAMRKDSFIKLGGLYDMNPVGSSDLHFAHALIGNVKQTIKKTLTNGYKESVCEWADRLSQIVGEIPDKYMKTVGYVNVRIKHHYHGNKNDRQYVDRWNILESNHFDPNTFYFPSILTGGYIHPELRKINESISRQFKEALIQYFRNRNEDNMVVAHEVQSNSDPRIVYNRSSQIPKPTSVWNPIIQPQTDMRPVPVVAWGVEQYRKRHEDPRIVYSKPQQPQTYMGPSPSAFRKPEPKNKQMLQTVSYVGAMQSHSSHHSSHHPHDHCHHTDGYAQAHPSY